MKARNHSDLFSKRNITKNILNGISRKSLKRAGIFILLVLVLSSATCSLSSCSSQKNISQRRIEKEKERKDKEARKKYEQAIRQHEKNQSAATRSMMKETKKESPKNTPLKKSSGKKCK
jgi:spermidine synthase